MDVDRGISWICGLVGVEFRHQLAPTLGQAGVHGCFLHDLSEPSARGLNSVRRDTPGWLDLWALTSLVVSTLAARPRSGLRERWSQWTRLCHTELGGLTEGDLRVIMYSPRALAFEACPPSPVLPTCVYSVAGDTIEAGLPLSGPITRVLHPLCVLALGKNLYHGGGLYPRCARGVRPTFLLPTVLHRPATWCRRRLTPLETRICVLGLQAPDSARVLGRLHPGQCLHEGLWRLLRGMGVMYDGGVVSF
jgi:hypothetical protein